MIVRPESKSDMEAIQRVNREAFGRAGEATLVDALRQAGALPVSLVAVVENQVVGHIAFSPVPIMGADSPVRVAGLGPLAVLPGYQGQGIGARLVEAGLDACRHQEIEIVVVLGHADYYPKFGFAMASAAGLTCEYAVPPEAFMVSELSPGVLAGLAGVARYHPAFANV
jgi:putative acetyltransferase